MVAHSLAKAGMFLGAGNIIHARGHDRIAELGGNQRALLLTWVAMALAAASLIGLPPSSGFAGKLWLLQAALQDGLWWWAVVIVVGTLLTAAYLFRLFDAAAYSGADRGQGDTATPAPMPWTAVVLGAGAVALGLAAPQLAALLRIGGLGA